MDKNNELQITTEDEEFMRLALEEARAAASEDEVPIGAVIVRDGKIIARAHNRREGSKCATHHAEILAIEEACRTLGGWRLPDTTLYVTLEPCAMCAGAIIKERVTRYICKWFIKWSKRYNIEEDMGYGWFKSKCLFYVSCTS